jgi:hypothetical protein
MPVAGKGPDTLSVSAITKSRARNEPVGAGDALKGYNYNNPRVAIEILERINEIAGATKR